jgi:hypothetical protein
MKEVRSLPVLLAVVAGLAGCASAMKSMVVSNATPESLGISTTQYRGQSCDQLAQQLDMYRKEQAKSGGDELGRKSWGWHADAVQVVQNDQGCTPASAAAGKTIPKEMKMYFYCYVHEDQERVNTRGIRKSQTSVYTGVFERTVSLTDPMHRYNLAKAFTEEFRLKVVPLHDLGKTDPTCAFEDSPTTANAMRVRMRDISSIGVSATNIDSAWQPTVTVQPVAAGKPVAAKPAAAKPGAPIDVPALGARFEPISEKVAKSARLVNANGAAIVSVTAGGPAARAGLRAKDIVTDISGQAITRPEDIEAVISKLSDIKAPVQVRRAGKTLKLTVDFAASPAAATTKPARKSPL